MSRAKGDQVWPPIRRINGEDADAVSSLEVGTGDKLDGVMHLTGPGIRTHADGTVTISGSNVEHDPTTGIVTIRGEVVK